MLLRCGKFRSRSVAPADHGRRQRHARFVFRRRAIPRLEAGGRARAPADRGGRGHPRHRRRIDAPRRGAGVARRGAPARAAGARGAGGRRRAGLGGYPQAGADARGDRGRRGHGQRHHRAVARPGRSRRWRRRRSPCASCTCRASPAPCRRIRSYHDVVREVRDFLAGRVAAAERAGIARERIVVDPGFGFGKTLEHNLALLRALREFRPLGVALLAGLSRKSMLGKLTGREPHGARPRERRGGADRGAERRAHRAGARRRGDARRAGRLERQLTAIEAQGSCVQKTPERLGFDSIRLALDVMAVHKGS